MSDTPHLRSTYLIIAMHQYMSHTDYLSPWSIRVIGYKFRREFICSLANDLNILYDCEKQDGIIRKILASFSFDKAGNIVNGHQYMS